MKGTKTHQVAVGAFIFHNNRMLFLERLREPLVWAPPGGRLKPDENPITGLKREVFEECRILVEPIIPVSVAIGAYHQGLILAIFYLCISNDLEIVLSEESRASAWLSFEEIGEKKKKGELIGNLKEYKRAFKVYQSEIERNGQCEGEKTNMTY